MRQRVWIQMTMASEERDRFHEEPSGHSRINLPEVAIADSSGDVAGHALEESSSDLFEKEPTELGHIERRLFEDVCSLSGFLGAQIQLPHDGLEFLFRI